MTCEKETTRGDKTREDLQHGVARLIGRLWRDEALEERFVADPRPILEDAGLPVPSEAEIVVLRDSDELHHLVQPAPGHPHELEVNLAIETVREQLSADFHVVRDSAERIHFVLPTRPSGVDLAELKEEEVIALAAATGLGLPTPRPEPDDGE